MSSGGGLYSLKKKRKKDREANQGKVGEKKVTAGYLRLQKDLNELELEDNVSLTFPDPNDITSFIMQIRPEDGFYKGYGFDFSYKVDPHKYPHEVPKVHCMTKVYHPNIDLDGNICLNILREDWRPVLSISSIMFGLHYILLEPNPKDPLNKEAAQVLKENVYQFKQNVKRFQNSSSW